MIMMRPVQSERELYFYQWMHCHWAMRIKPLYIILNLTPKIVLITFYWESYFIVRSPSLVEMASSGSYSPSLFLNSREPRRGPVINSERRHQSH